MISSHQQEVREDRPPPQGLTNLHVETVPTLRSYLAPFSCSCQTCPGDPRMVTSLFKYDKPVFLMTVDRDARQTGTAAAEDGSTATSASGSSSLTSSMVLKHSSLNCLLFFFSLDLIIFVSYKIHCINIFLLHS